MSHAKKTISARKPKSNEQKIGERKEKRDIIGQQFIMKKSYIGDVVSICNVYMTWQV